MISILQRITLRLIIPCVLEGPEGEVRGESYMYLLSKSSVWYRAQHTGRNSEATSSMLIEMGIVN